ncbi:MAG: DinB family protein [Gemmatimonadales bacterium]|nr:MAG: DinB family protein [Gemmatimonadales bacterium]
MMLHRFQFKGVHCFLTVQIALLLAGPMAAQDKSKLMDDFLRLRRNVVGMVDAMPASGLRTAPTEGVRDFAQQIEHIAAGAVNIIALGVDTDAVDLGMSPGEYLNDKDALKEFVNRAFDRVDAMLASMSPEDLQEAGSLFGQLERPRWMIVQVAHEHGVWTLGATVPYLRMNGAAPPGYNLVPGVGGGD